MSSFLGVGAEDLDRLSPTEAVGFFADLLRAEAVSSGRPLASVRAPLSTSAPDGGVDITVRAPDGAPDGGVDITVRAPDGAAGGQGLIAPGLTCYQVKSGRNVRLGRAGWGRLLCNGNREKLPHKIESCIGEGGMLAVVLFGVDKPSRRGDPTDSLKEYLKECHSLDGTRVAVWQQSDLLGFLGAYPALQRRLKRTEAAFRDHASWSSVPEMRSKPFVGGERQDAFAERVRDKLRRANGGPVDVRITGMPGSGKTRIVREITDTDDLRPLTVYFDRPAPDAYAALDRMAREGSHAVVVVDECEDSEWEKLRERAAGAGGRVKLVTIHNGGGGGAAPERLPELDLRQIKKIISGHLGSAKDGAGSAAARDEAVDGLAKLCIPSPRYAHRLADRLGNDDMPVMGQIDEDSVHNMYIADSLRVSSSEFQRRKAVLMWFALFEKAGYEGQHSADAEFLAAKITEWEGIRRGEFNRIVDDLRSLKILQGHRTLYVAPTLLQLWLWREWWRINGPSFDLDEFARAGPGGEPLPMPDDLFGWFSSMFVNARVSADASRVASDLLGRDGPFEWFGAWKSERAARLFHALARADPDSALRLLERTVGTWSYEMLAEFTGRREVMWSLERMVREEKNFEAAADVIIRLAAAETEDHAGSATSVFARLFTMAPGDLAYAQAGTGRRLAYLEGVLGSDDRRRRLLGIEACRLALESVRFSRMDYDRETMVMGAVKGASLGSGVFKSYKRVLDMLVERMGAMDGEERKRSASAILDRVQELSRFRDMSEHTARVTRRLFDEGWADRSALVRATETVVSVDAPKMAPRAAAMWRRLAGDLAGKTYGDRLRRYVAMDIPADEAGRGGAPGRPGRAAPQIKKLAAEAVRSPRALLNESEWLFGPGVHNAAAFGEELARQDRKFSLLPRLLRALASAPEPSDPLLGGYMRQVHEGGDVSAWENALDEMASDSRLAPLVPKITRWSGMTDRAWNRVTALYRSGVIDKSDIAVFAHGWFPRTLSSRAFAEALSMLLDDPSDADMGAALALLHGGCAHDGARHRLPADVAYGVVTNELFLRREEGSGRSEMDHYGWKDVAVLLAKQEPSRIGDLSNAFFGSIGTAGGVFDAPHPLGAEVLDYMGCADPDAVWGAAVRHISSPPDPRTKQVLEWAGGRFIVPHGGEEDAAPTPFLNVVARERVWEWIDGDKEARAMLLARYVPRQIVRNGRCIARDLLARYGDSDAVRREMHAHFSTGAFFGSRVEHHKKEMAQCTKWIKEESNRVVLRWLHERMGHIQADMDAAAEFEERYS